MRSVRATARGYYGGLIREPGDVFEMEGEAGWVEDVDAAPPQRPAPPPPPPPPARDDDEGGEGRDPRIDEVPPVEIPDDWAELHHRKVIALAQRILPGAQPGMTLDEAKAVITEELERRAAAQ